MQETRQNKFSTVVSEVTSFWVSIYIIPRPMGIKDRCQSVHCALQVYSSV